MIKSRNSLTKVVKKNDQSIGFTFSVIYFNENLSLFEA